MNLRNMFEQFVIGNMFRKFYDLADDNASPPSTIYNGGPGSGFTPAGAGTIKNWRSREVFPLQPSSVSPRHTLWGLYGRVSPVGQYANAPIGSTYKQFIIASAVVAGIQDWVKVSSTLWASSGNSGLITDPGDAAAIPVVRSGLCPIVTAAGETRTLAIPTYVDQEIALALYTDGGDCTVTVASAIDANGSTVIVLNDAADYILLRASYNGAALIWRVVANEGCLVGDATHKGALIADPGDGLAIPVTQSGFCPIVSAGAETRTLAVPTFAGQEINLAMKTDGGDAVITVASAFDSNGSTVIVMNDAGDNVVLKGIYNGSALAWRLVSNNGCLVGDATHKGLLIADPGDGLAIPVLQSGWCPIVSAGAETRTLAAPTFAGQKITLTMKTDGGDCVTTVAAAFDADASTVVTHNDAGDSICFEGIYSGSSLVWRIAYNSGCLIGSATRQASPDVVYYNDVTLTSAQVKALKATPITIVGAPGANLAIVPIAINIVCNYGGTNVFTETDDDFSIEYVGSSTEIKEIECTGLIDQAVDEWRYITFEHAESFIPAENEAVGVTNLDDEFAGNAGGDNTVLIRLWYRLVPTDA